MQRHFAKFLVLITVAVMVFGLLSMSIAMSAGMGHCPVMRGVAGCPSPYDGAAFSIHHIDGFQSMMTTTTALAVMVFFAIIAFSRLFAMRPFFISRHSQRVWPLANGPPSPIVSLLFWSALHNKFGDIAFFRVQKMVLA